MKAYLNCRGRNSVYRACVAALLILLEVAAIVRRQSHYNVDREFLHQVRGTTHFGLLE